MKKSLFIMALGAIALTSCSQDEIIEVKQDAIAFSAFTENASRATATTAGTLTDFIVYANEYGSGGKPYIQGVVADDDNSLPGAGTWRLKSTYYWPIKPLDFYCISPAAPTKGTIAVSAANVPSLSTYTVESGHAEDLLYSVATGLKRGEGTVGSDGVAPINFRHALSMIQFQFASEAAYDLDVTVSSIKLVNVAQTGAYALPEYTTSPWLDSEDETADDRNEVDNGNGVADDANEYRTRGTWTIASDAYTNTYTWGAEEYSATADQASAPGTAYFLLPQTVTAATPDDVLAGEKWSDAYFELDCVIKKDEVTVYTGLVQIPVAAAGTDYTWKEGYKYLYTFTFGQGGGYYPGSDDPAIVPISFNITVDAMQDATPAPEVPVEVAP